MTDHGNLTAQSGRSGWRPTHKFILALVIGVFAMAGYLALPTAASPHPAQSAPQPAVAGGPALGDATDAGWSKQFVGKIVSMGSVELLGADSLQFAQGAPEPAVAGGPALGDATQAGWSKQLVGKIVSMGSVELLGVDSLQFAQGAPEPAVAGGPAIGSAMDAAGEQRLAEEDRSQDYTTWLNASHAHAAQYGQGAPLPSQF
jgi:hypothetical protein